MKALLGKVLKFLFILTYPLLVIGLIALGTLLFIRTREFNELNKGNPQQQIIELQGDVAELNQQISLKNTEISALKSSIEDLQTTGRGTVAGKIFPFVAAGASDFNQYQRVCAESTTNKNVQFCVTVSAIEQTYSINLPVGTYNVYAELFPTPAADSPFAAYRAYYTQYVSCVREKGANQCDESKLGAAVNIEVKAGDSVVNVDPINWKKQG